MVNENTPIWPTDSFFNNDIFTDIKHYGYTIYNVVGTVQCNNQNLILIQK